MLLTAFHLDGLDGFPYRPGWDKPAMTVSGLFALWGPCCCRHTATTGAAAGRDPDGRPDPDRRQEEMLLPDAGCPAEGVAHLLRSRCGPARRQWPGLSSPLRGNADVADWYACAMAWKARFGARLPSDMTLHTP